MDDHIDDNLSKTKDGLFVNTKCGSTVVLTFVFAYGWWRIYQQADDGASRNWPLTVGHKFRGEEEGLEFLRLRGWSKLDPGAARSRRQD